MCEADLEQEKDAVDFITNCMFSVSFLQNISDVIFGPKRNEVSVGEFYDYWLHATEANEDKIPFNLGVILGYLYCGILWAKQHWFDLLPEVKLVEAEPKWGFSGIECSAPKEKTPSLKYVIRRIRNALAHGYYKVTVPENIDRSELLSQVKCRFQDKDPNDPENTFDITLNIDRITNFIKVFQSLIHQHIRSSS